MEYSFNIFYYVNIYKKWWKPIVVIMAISMILTMISSLMKPPVYVSKVTLLRKESSSSSSSPLGNLLGISSRSSGDVIYAVLASRRMAKDITEKFKLSEKPDFWWGINTWPAVGGTGIEVQGNDPLLVQQIANFSVENLDKLNAELNITPNKPMVTVLDKAIYGVKKPKATRKKMVISGMGSFLIFSLYIFLLDYVKKLKNQ